MATTSNDDQGSWTKVERKKRKNGPQSLGNRNSEDSGNPSRGMRVRDRNVSHGGGYTRTALPGNAGTNREFRAVKDRESGFRAGMAGTIGNEQAAAGGSTSDISKLPGANSYNQNSSVPDDFQPSLTKESYLSVATRKVIVDERRNAIPRAASLISKPQSNMKHPSTFVNPGSDLGRDHTPSETFGSNVSSLCHQRGGKLHQVVGHQKVLDEGEENDATKMPQQATSIAESSRRSAILGDGGQQATLGETSYDIENPPSNLASSSATTSLPLVQSGHPPIPPPAPQPQAAPPSKIWTVVSDDGSVEFLKYDDDEVIRECSMCTQEAKIIKGDDELPRVDMFPSYVLHRVGQTILLLPQIFFIVGPRKAYIRIDNADRQSPLVELASDMVIGWRPRAHIDDRRFDLHVMGCIFHHMVVLLKQKADIVLSSAITSATTTQMIAPAVGLVIAPAPIAYYGSVQVITSACYQLWERIWAWLSRDVYPRVPCWLKLDKFRDLEHIDNLQNLINENKKIKEAIVTCFDLFEKQHRRSCYLPYLSSRCKDMAKNLSRSLAETEKKRSNRRLIKRIAFALFCSIGCYMGVLATASVGLKEDTAKKAQRTLWHLGCAAVVFAFTGGLCSYAW